MRGPVPLAVCVAAAASAALASRIDPNRPYPKFQVGVTGIHVSIEKGLVFTVRQVEPGSPADGKVGVGDVIVAAGGRPLQGEDPRVPLGQAVTEAEATDGRLALDIKRDGRAMRVVVRIPVLGPYSKTWPLKCRKSEAIVRQTAGFVARSQQPDGAYKLGNRPDRDSLTACLAGLFLLSTGEAKYLENVRRQARNMAAAIRAHPTTSTWHLGMQGILLGEYYLRTGDATILPALEALCNQAAKSQAAGAWGHGAGVNPGYVQSGLMNSAGVPVLTTLVLAQECGVAVDRKAFLRALVFFYRNAGHGCVCYGDHRAELFPNTNGRNGMLACALSLLDGKPYRMASEHLALLLADSYYAHEFGHTGGGFNVIWRGLATVHVPKDEQDHYRRQMDKLAWYYDLCRLRGGGFSMLPSPPSTTRYCGVQWGTGAIGLTYTAPRRTLRITGAPPTRFSHKVEVPPLPWGRPADLAFLRTDYCEGFGKETHEPHEIHEMLRGANRANAPVDFCAKMMRHYSPMVRTWAARRLAERADQPAIDAIVQALHHSDPRVRRAALDGISGYDNWGRPTSPGRLRGKIPPVVVSRRCVPIIERILRDPDSAWWEIDGALFALGRAEPADIRRNLPLILKFARQHDEWYLREAAFWAIVGLGKDIRPEEFQLLADIYAAESHVFARASADAGFAFLVKGCGVRLPREAQAKVAATLGRTLYEAPIAPGYGTGGRHEAAHRTMMILKHFDTGIYRWLVGDFATYLDYWTPNYQHSVWLITGSPWQPGVVKVLDYLGARGRELLPALKKCLARAEREAKARGAAECRQKLLEAIKALEERGGN